MIQRINLLLRSKNITAKQFAEEIGIQPSGMSHILGGRNNPSLDFVSKVLRRYPEIDANWLLLGKGEMYNVAGMPVQGAADTAAEPVATPVAAVAPVVAVPQPLAEPTLFSSEELEATSPVVPHSIEEAAPQPAPVVFAEADVPPAVEESEKNGSQPMADRTIARVLLIYNDNTFEELRHR